MVTVTIGTTTYEQPTQLFINNEFVDATSGKTIDAINPSTEELIATVQAASASDVDRAVEAASKAFKSWSSVTGVERGQLLRKLADATLEDKELIATVEAADSGKPRDTNALGDIEHCADVFNYYSGFADKIHGQVVMDDPKVLSYVRHQPYGVVGQIIPWNYPLAMAAWKLAPALAAGNCVVLKSAENTPLSLLYFCKHLAKVFPPGVVNIISGYGGEAGEAMASHMKISKIAFTGSTAVGKRIMRAAAESNLKNVTLECGGKSPMVVFDDADLEQSAEWAYFGIMFNAGQVCCATSRLLVQKGIYEDFLKQLAKVCEKNTIAGDALRPDVTHGPQVSKAQFDRVLGYIDIAKSEGARVVAGGTRIGEKGYFIQPTVLGDVKPTDRVFKEEIFGPVVSVTPFDTYEEGIDLANDSDYGLGGAVFSKDITKAHLAANAIDTGYVWINSSNDQDYHLPFGGFKMSGIGSELGSYGLDAYLHPKSIQVNLGNKL